MEAEDVFVCFLLLWNMCYENVYYGRFGIMKNLNSDYSLTLQKEMHIMEFMTRKETVLQESNGLEMIQKALIGVLC